MQQIKDLSPEQIEALKKDINPMFLSTRYDGMTSIKGIAITMRFNEVFGFGKWQTNTENMISKRTTQKTKRGDRECWYATCKVIFTVPEYGIHYECEAGSLNDDEGDAMKGAITDSLTKIASYLGVGWKIYCSK